MAHQAQPRRLPLYAGFAATGTALTLPGALLPVLLRRWSLGDARGGVLLGFFFAGCTLGSFGARGRMHRAVAAGAAAIALGALALAAAGSITAYTAMLLYGCGLGLMMTATGLLMSQRFPAARRIEMVRLNLAWAIGAACGPWVALHSTHLVRTFAEVATVFVVAAAWAWWREGEPLPATPPLQPEALQATQPWQARLTGTIVAVLRVPWPLLLLLFCDTGVEASISGWMTAYAQRAGDALGMTIGAATLLWAGVLCSRAVHALPWATRLPARAVLLASLLAMAAALALLIAWQTPVVTLIAATLLGLAAGPVYPLVIAAALRWEEDAGIFVVGGLGSAALPLVTGAVSAGMHSLRWGLGIPLAGSLVMTAIVAGAAKTVIGDK